jgi:uncharacterized protein YjiK/Fe-S cluster biogenesis protein NfuA
MSSSAKPRSSIRLAAGGLVLAGVISVLSISGASAAFQAQAQAGRGPVRQAQVLEEERTGVSSPVGLAFSSATNAFYVLGGRRGSRGPLSEADVATLTPFNLSPDSDRSGSARLAAAVQDPINIAFDPRGNRLLLLSHARELLEVRALGSGDLDRGSLNRRDATRLELQNPQGMTVDPSSGAVYVLDAGSSSIVRVEPDASGRYETGTTSEIDLRPSGLTGVRGLAFDPATGNLQVGSGQTLYELTTGGVVVSIRDLSGLELATPEGMVFAPSGDLTDASSQSSLYVADSGTASGTGQIVELSLAPQVVVAAIDFTASLVRTIDTAAFNPPSPDPSGLTYLPQSNTLLMTDGEVEETVNGITHFRGVNVWEMTLTGNVVDTANISKVAPTQVPMTNEPVGVTWKPSNGHYFVSEDGGKRVYDLNPGGDGNIGTSDDSWTSFSTLGVGNGDPEGITYDTQNDRLFVADGVNAEIYEYTTAGALVSHFDVQRYAVADPETVEFNAATGTLFVLSNRQSGPIIIETTRSGALLKTIDVSAAPEHRPAGLAYAPASNGSGVKRFYWADREIDNNNDPNIVDGKIFEFTAPGGPANNPPTITSDGGLATATTSVPENQTAVTDVDATDPDAGNTLTYSISGGADAAKFSIVASTGVLTFVTAPDFEAPTDADGNNIYDVTVSVSDGNGGSDSQAIAVTVTDVPDTTQPPEITSDGGGPTAAKSVSENQTAVTDVDATDPDVGDTLTYLISGGADAASFSIVPATGVLTFVSAPNYEGPTDSGANNVYDVTVSVSDGNGGSDSQAIAVTVTNVNEFVPGITSDGGGTTATFSRPENQTAVTDVDASDGDGDALTYSISGGADAADFAINPSDGVLTFAAPPDFEAPADANLDNVYEVVVDVSDGTFSDTQTISVTVTGVPETPVITSDGGEATATKSVPENETAVTDVNASDGDGDTLTYSIPGGADADDFVINSSDGVLTFASPPDFEQPVDANGDNIYEVTVQASDGGLSDTQAITVTVTNVVDTNQPPVITSDGGGATAAKSVLENQTAVTDVDATDANPGDTLIYSKSGTDAAHFTIDPLSGVLAFLVAPDFEAPADAGANNVYDVTVEVSDGFLSDTQAIAVTVLGVNEFTPVVTSDGGDATAAKSVPENQTAVTDVDASDGDGDTLTYSISGGADAASFSIVPATGVLTFVSAPNFEVPTDSGANNVYDVSVQVSDGTTTDTQAIAVTVTNVPENPVITSDGGGATAAKSAPENQTAVTDVDASDGDGDTLTYSISGGADAASFSIVPATGVLTFVSAPNFEAPTDSGANNVYDVTVAASDGSLSDTQAIAVTVTDVVEGSGSQLYFSLRAAATVGGVAAANEDIVFFNGTSFSLAFDGSDVGIATLRIDAFSWVDATRLLLSFDVAGTVPGIAGTVDDSDVVLFTSTSLGPVTAGTFSMYFQGADVGLTTDAEDVDAVELLPNGRILLSTVGAVGVTGVSGVDEDLLEFTPTSLGNVTAGTFTMYFDGSDVGLSTTADEDVDATAVDTAGKIYLSTLGPFAVTGVSGADEDVFVFTPTSLGSVTAGTFSPTLYFDGSVHGLAANDVFAIDLP